MAKSKKSTKVSSDFTKEEEMLLQDFSRNVSTKSSVLFYGNAAIVSVVPLWLFWRVHMMDPIQSGILFVLMTAISTYLLTFAYKNVKFLLKHKAAQTVQDQITRETLKKYQEDKKMNKNDKEEIILLRMNEVADYQATNFAIFYNNALFLSAVVLCSFVVLRTFTPNINYILSMAVSSGLVALISTGSQ